MHKGVKNKPAKLNNTGSAIVTVIVVVTFISILATTILYMSGMNFFMKMTDLRTKESFYDGEMALEEIKAALMAEASKACEEAYTKVVINYAATDGATRYSLFQNEFLNTLEANWQAKTHNAADPSAPFSYETVLQEIVDEKYRSGISLEASILNAGSLEVHGDEGYALIRGVTLQYTDADGYTTVISTDYLIMTPKLNWGVDGSKTEWASGEGAAQLVRSDIDMSEYVQYYNWVKK
ncbi:MAG: hypothetical protein K2I22_11205 [Lachnospiraceae bacterium]|nr:hypothetical protein [Lachnospiraceae bacterium]